MKCALVWLFVFFGESALAITLDGKLDEPEWQNATVMSEFTTVSPYSLSQPEYQTEVRLISNPNGIYIGFKNAQPLRIQSTELTARDSDLSADSNQVIIDFDASSVAAYGFEVGNGGSIRDGIWRDENQYSNDWDGNWQAQTSQTDSHWYSEIYLPWNMVAMSESTGSARDIRDIKIYLARRVRELAVSYATVAASSSRQRFMSDFKDLRIASFNQSSLQVFGYASAQHNTLTENNESNMGADVFWKSSDGKQLSATINPDFGQVESDGLVVNFSPNEVFFSERRPFFTQNQALFDVQGPESLRVIHTRRIGSQPDQGPDPFSDITGAVKFTDNNQYVNYGVFAASESEGTESLGRDFYVGRVLRTAENYNLGFTSTFTNRPDIDRQALINAVDYEYRWGKALLLRAQALQSSIDSRQINNPESSSKTDTGRASWLTLEHQVSENQSQSLSLSHYAKDFDVNDLGFLPRANLDAVAYEYAYRNPAFSDTSRVNDHAMRVYTEHQYNDAGNHLGSTLELYDEWSFKDTSAIYWYLIGFSSGRDDRITRGNNLVNTESGYQFQSTWVAQNSNKLRGHAHINWRDKFVDGKGVELHLHPSYQFTDSYSTSLGLFYTQTDNWLNWTGGNQLGSYDRTQAQASLDFDARLSDNQELRVKFQWVGFSASALNGLNIASSGRAERNQIDVDDFSFSTTALQIRYRYELAPLSNLFVVYTRGGNTDMEETQGLGNLFTDAWENRDSSNMFVKLRYQF